MTWRLECPACGHYGSVRNGGGPGKVFACRPCGVTVHALNKSDLEDKLARLAKKIHTARVINKVPAEIRQVP
ncbi:unnamed protein product [marine sediment metagenome]|uniref:Uncharacterized protein n=1 Tax=marine sediment metagenome TaxID=412755 RepID=X1KDM2_9ZZZZ